MSDRALLFLFSIVVVIGGLGAAVWLLVSGQAGSMDGLFLLLTCLLVVLAFGLYIGFVIGQARLQAAAPVAQTAKTSAGAPGQAKPATQG
ncbi:MAG: hypothetical protein ABSH50_30635 [Bryobacteraceae bacterium]